MGESYYLPNCRPNILHQRPLRRFPIGLETFTGTAKIIFRFLIHATLSSFVVSVSVTLQFQSFSDTPHNYFSIDNPKKRKTKEKQGRFPLTKIVSFELVRFASLRKGRIVGQQSYDIIQLLEIQVSLCCQFIVTLEAIGIDDLFHTLRVKSSDRQSALQPS
jgi:hypothetical protein